MKQSRNYKNISWLWIIIVSLFICISLNCFTLKVYGENDQFKNIKGKLKWENGIVVKKEYEVFEYNSYEKGVPSVMQWEWSGKGEVWMSAEFSDGNVIYYIMKGSKEPNIDKITYIDGDGIPRIIVPYTLELSDKQVKINLLKDYHRFCGGQEVTIKNIKFSINTKHKVEIKKFEITEYSKISRKINNDNSTIDGKKNYLKIQIPQGNSQNEYYLVKNEIFPVEIRLRAMSDKKVCGNFKINFSDGVEIINYDSKKFKIDDNNTLNWNFNICKGYFEDTAIILIKENKTSEFEAEFNVEDKKEELRGKITCLETEYIKNNLVLLDDGIYPFQYKDKSIVLKKDLKNYIRIKQEVSDVVHKMFGKHENEDEPAGYAAGVIENNGIYDLPLRVKVAITDDDGKEITEFRGEHLQIAGEIQSLPEVIMLSNSMKTEQFKMPIFADAYSVKPGLYKGRLTITLFGTNVEIVNKEFSLNVENEKQIQSIIGIVAIILSILSIMMLIIKHKKWLGGIKTSEIILIALFTAVKFSVVDIPYFILGDIVRGLLAPLGPFVQIFTGIFWDVFNPMLLVTLVILVRRPGVVIISSLVRLLLKGIAFGSFNPVAILLMLSYAAIADFLLYVTGFTSRKRKIKPKLSVFIMLALIFAFKHLYSTYTFYYIWSYLYRLYYPDWYININAIISVVYACIGCISGVFLGNKLERVID